jgi:hypothetical protein
MSNGRQEDKASELCYDAFNHGLWIQETRRALCIDLSSHRITAGKRQADTSRVMDSSEEVGSHESWPHIEIIGGSVLHPVICATNIRTWALATSPKLAAASNATPQQPPSS